MEDEIKNILRTEREKQIEKHKQLCKETRSLISGIKALAKKTIDVEYKNDLEAYGDFCLKSGEMEHAESKIWYAKKVLDDCARGYLFNDFENEPLVVEQGYDSIEETVTQHIKAEIKLLGVIYKIKELKKLEGEK